MRISHEHVVMGVYENTVRMRKTPTVLATQHKMATYPVSWSDCDSNRAVGHRAPIYTHVQPVCVWLRNNICQVVSPVLVVLTTVFKSGVVRCHPRSSQ